MATRDANWAIDSFLDVERRMQDVLRVVPYESEHMRTYAPVLASILLDTCSLTESVLKSTMDHARYSGIAGIARIRAKRYSATPPYLNINDLRTVFRSDWLYARPVWLLNRSVSSYPWHAWRTTAPHHPKWWTAYNDAKHNRFGNSKRATLSNTIHALKGCFLALVMSLEFRPRLVERGLIRCSALPYADLQTAARAWEPLATAETVVSTSALFAYKFQSTGSPSYARDCSMFL